MDGRGCGRGDCDIAGDERRFGIWRDRPIAAAVLLALGAFRTLRAMSGGLRLLCGAWGIAFGLAWYAPAYNFPEFIPGMLAIGAPTLVSAIGLALVVLHKEKKA